MNNGQNDYKNDRPDGQEQSRNQGRTDWNEYYRARGFERQPATAAPNDPAGSSSLILGVIALAAISFCQIASLVCGIIAMCRARDSRMMLRFETSSAKAGRICGLIAVIVSVTVMFAFIIGMILTVVLGVGLIYPFIAFSEYTG